MNIFFLDSIETTTYGGMEEWIRLTAAGLSQRGHTVTVAGRRGSEYLRRAAAENSGVTALELDISGDFNPCTISKIKNFLAANKTDVVIVNFNKDVRLAGLAARWQGGPKVVWSVGLDITKDTAVHRYLTPKLIDGVIVPSEALKRQITRYDYVTPEIVKVIPIGIEDESFAPVGRDAAADLRSRYRLPEDSIVAVTVGRFVRQKGHIHLVYAASALNSRHDNLFFLLLGDGPMREDLQLRIRQLNLEERFVFAGMVDNVASLLSGADLMIHPSIEEPFGIALLEGMRAGLPVVATEVGGIPEVVTADRTALLVPPADAVSLSTAIDMMLTSKTRMKAFGQAGQQRWRTEFPADTMVDRIERYLIQLTKPAGCSCSR
ncbi:MAG: glycosyltransferase family 4 protein [bacterium]